MFARRVAVVGTGYVGLTTGACLASLGHRVSCADVDPDKVERLRRGEVGIREDGLTELVDAGIAAGRLSFVVGAAAALAELAESGGPAEVVFLCVPTPMGVGGVADLTAVESVVDEIRTTLAPGTVVVNKSTVPVGTAVRTAELLGRDDIAVVSNPEFLREGSAVHDFLHPDRIVVGASAQDAAERVAALYARHHDHGTFGCSALRSREQPHAVDHRHPEVRDHGIEVFLEHRECALAVAHADDIELHVDEAFTQRLGERLIVIDEEHARFWLTLSHEPRSSHCTSSKRLPPYL